jgi:hypothetical protein
MGASAAGRELSSNPAEPRPPAVQVDPLPAIVEAARAIDVPLAVADARTPGAPLLFANAAAARLAGRTADALEGEPVAALAGRDAGADACAAVASALVACVAGRPRPVVLAADSGAAAEILSFAPVPGADGAPSYVICAALARGGRDEAARDAAVERADTQLALIARALEWLMRESRVAAQADGGDATRLAGQAVRDAAGSRHG